MYLKSTQTIFLFSLLTACTEEENIKNSTSTDPTSDWAADADDTGDIDDTGDTGEPDTGDEDPADLALAGHWADSWGSNHMIDNTLWDSGWALYNISQYDNESGWIIAQNDSTNFYNPDLWSKFEWTTDDDGEFYYCQSAYAEADEQAAIDAAGADFNDLTAGCGGFGWTQIRPYASFFGSYDDQWGSQHSVSAFSWVSGSSSYHISQYDDEVGWIIAQNDTNNTYNPDLWSKFELTSDSAGALYYCQSAYAEADEQSAIDAAGADSNDLTSGCGGFGWTAMRDSLPITGSWVDNYGGSHSIDAFGWATDYGSYHVSQSDSSMGWLVAQNDSNNSYNPDLWSKFEWTMDSDGEYYYCQSAYAEADEQAAIDAAGADFNDLTTGCGGFGWTQMRSDATFFGSYDDEWGSQHSVSAFSWVSGSSSYHISQYDDEAGWIIAQNDSNNTYNPDLWSKFELASDSAGALYYCQSAYAEVDEQAAIDAAGADTNDLTSGCGGFGWTAMRDSLPITGSWVDNYGGSHSIDAFGWTTDYGSYHVSQSDSSMGWLVAQNDSNNTYNPDLWSKFEWTTDSNGTLYYCQSAYAEADEAAAIAAPGADMSDPVAGCSGFPWTELTVPSK